MTPDEPFKEALSDAANSAAAVVPTIALILRALDSLHSDVNRLQADADRLVRALKRMQPDADAG